MTLRRTLLRPVPLACAALLSLSANAVPPHMPDLVSPGNEWRITFYHDNAPGHTVGSTQTICFFPVGAAGTHQFYIWVSTSYPDWNGRATQEGDQIFMYGDYQFPFPRPDVGHDAMQWEIVTDNPKTLGAGHWQEWVEDGAYGISMGWGNARVERTGRCVHQTADEAIDAGKRLPIPVDETGKALEGPAGNVRVNG